MTFGPLVVSLPRLFLLISILSAFVAMHLLVRGDARTNASRALWTAMIGGFVLARLAYVVTHASHYQANPLESLYFWDGGYLAVAGLAGAFVIALGLAWRWRLPGKSVWAPFLVGLGVWGSFQLLQASALQSAPELPDVALADLSGQPQSVRAFAGRPIVVNLWASWCPPCRREMPVLAAAQAARRDVHFLFVNQSEQHERVSRYLAHEGLALRNVLLDARGELADRFEAPGLPTTLLFGADGRLVQVHMGELSAPKLGDYLDELTDTGN